MAPQPRRRIRHDRIHARDEAFVRIRRATVAMGVTATVAAVGLGVAVASPTVHSAAGTGSTVATGTAGTVATSGTSAITTSGASASASSASAASTPTTTPATTAPTVTTSPQATTTSGQS